MNTLEKDAPSSALSESKEALSQKPAEIATSIINWNSDESYQQKCSRLTNLSKLESEMLTTSVGFLCINIGIALQDSDNLSLNDGTLHQQKFSKDEFFKNKPDITTLMEINNPPFELANIERVFDIPPLSTAKLQDSERIFGMPPPPTALCQDGLEQYFESFLEYLEQNHTNHDYLNAQSHDIIIRKQLGLPTEGVLETGLYAGDRLLSTVIHYPGIHSSYVYISSSSGSAFALHVEDFYLNSANIVYAGAPKLWIVIAPGSKDQLESQVAEFSKSKSTDTLCGQFVRHQSLLLRPSLLREWGVSFQITLQQPGYLMLLQPHAYHYGLNLGANIAEAINYTGPKWIVPPLYKPCTAKCFNDKSDPMLPAGMKMRQPRPLNLAMELPESQQKSEQLRSRNAIKKKQQKSKQSLQQRKSISSACKGKNNRVDLQSSISLTEESSASESNSIRNSSSVDQDLSFQSDEEITDTSIPLSNGTSNTIEKQPLSIPNQNNCLENSQLKGLRSASTSDGYGRTLTCTLSKTNDLLNKSLESISKRHPSDFPISAVFQIQSSSFPLNDDYHERNPRSKIEWWINWWKNHVEQSPHKSHIPKNLQDITAEHDLQRFLPPSENLDSSSSWLNDKIIFLTSQTFFPTEQNVRIIDPLTVSLAQQKLEKDFISNNCISTDKSKSISIILLPCCYENHWCLIVIKPSLKKFFIYNNTPTLNPIIQFVFNSYRKNHPNQQYTYKEVSNLRYRSWLSLNTNHKYHRLSRKTTGIVECSSYTSWRKLYHQKIQIYLQIHCNSE